MGKHSRNKGKAGERELANLLKEFGFEARRGQQYSGTETSADVVHDMGNFHVEVKRDESTVSVKMYAALAQADADRNKEHFPVVFSRRNGKPWVVTMYLEDWMQFVDKQGVLPDAEGEK